MVHSKYHHGKQVYFWDAIFIKNPVKSGIFVIILTMIPVCMQSREPKKVVQKPFYIEGPLLDKYHTGNGVTPILELRVICKHDPAMHVP